jgi:mono/diheme cytochrome c family protein
MREQISRLLALLAVAAPAGYAQQADLTDKQLRGRQVFAQSCGVCHLQPSLGVKTYGPVLNKAATGGNDEAMRAFIVNGTERMPSFKYYLKPAEIDAIIAYVRTVPAPVTPSKDSGKGKADEHD